MMNLEDAIRWYFNGGKKEADKKLPSLNSSVRASSPFDTCPVCGVSVVADGAICYACEVMSRRGRLKEVKSGYRGAVRAQYVDDAIEPSPSVSQFVTSSGAIINPFEESPLESLRNAAEEIVNLRAKLHELERVTSSDVPIVCNEILVTGRKFRKPE